MQDAAVLPTNSDSPRRWYRPQFSLRSILVLTSVAAIILAINFWPPKIAGGLLSYPDSRFRGYAFRAERGWPFLHLSFTSGNCAKEKETPVDVAGWPIGHPKPPRVTNWYKLTANIVVLLVIVAAFWWVVGWCGEMFRAAIQLLRGTHRRRVGGTLVLTTILCVVGVAAIGWGITMTRQVSFQVADGLLTSHLRREITGQSLKRLTLPPLFIAAGLLLLASARRWLQGNVHKVSFALAAFMMVALLVAVDVRSRSLLGEFVYDLVLGR